MRGQKYHLYQDFKDKTEENQGKIERTGESIAAFSGFSVLA